MIIQYPFVVSSRTYESIAFDVILYFTRALMKWKLAIHRLGLHPIPPSLPFRSGLQLWGSAAPV